MKRNLTYLQDAKQIILFMHALDRFLFINVVSCAICLAMEPFILIIGGAMVLDSLLQQLWNTAIWQVSFMLVLSLMVGMLRSFLQTKVEVAGMAINRDCNKEICLKAISLDYATFEDKKNLEEFEAADYNVTRNGGFGSYLQEMLKVLQGLFGCIIASGFLIDLCMSTVKTHGLLGIVTSRLGSFVVMIAMFVVLVLLYKKITMFVFERELSIYYENIDVNQKIEYMDDHINNGAEQAMEIRMYDLSKLLYEEWKKMTMVRNAFNKKKWKLTSVSLLLYSIINDTVLLLSYIFVILKTIIGAISIGAFTRYVGSVQQMNASLGMLVESLSKMQLCQSYLTFYTSFLHKKNKMDTGDKHVDHSDTAPCIIEFHHVGFHYPGSEDYILRDVSLRLDMHKHFALVGRNGAGKTTFIKLLCRLYDVSEGSITLNGIDIRTYDYQEYVNIFATVFQDFSLFAFSIRENVSCSKTAEDQRVWDALRAAGLYDKIKRMDQQLDTLLYHQLGDGINVSGGEAQKIAIARVLYKNAPFVILDEPTAALDPISEYEIYSHFNDMVKDKTSIYISHRMSSCRFCDRILVMDKGQLIQQGTHDELMKNDLGMYATLWNAQAKYYEKPSDEVRY